MTNTAINNASSGIDALPLSSRRPSLIREVLRQLGSHDSDAEMKEIGSQFTSLDRRL